jgi:hypothetical protein
LDKTGGGSIGSPLGQERGRINVVIQELKQKKKIIPIQEHVKRM